MEKKRSLLFVCYPSLGILDSWLSVINELRKTTNYHLIFLAPRARTIREVSPQSVIHRLAAELFDEFIWVDRWGGWSTTNDLFYAKKRSCKNKWLPQVFRTGKIGLKNHLQKKNISGVLCDVIIENSNSPAAIKEILASSTKRVSIPHGGGLVNEASLRLLNSSRQGPKRSSVSNKTQEKLRRDVMVYLYSERQKEKYRAFNIDPSYYRVVGIPRHERSWVEKICKNDDEAMPAGFEKGFILVISRPANDMYFPLRMKKKAIENIKKVALQLRKKIVIKPHPKETAATGNIGCLYEEILGEDEYGESWVYANKHLLVLGQHADIAICIFLSTATSDMVITSTPVISRPDAGGSKTGETTNGSRDPNYNSTCDSEPMGLCLEANERVGLEGQVERIVENRVKVLSDLRRAYDELFPTLSTPNRLIALEIKDFVGGVH